MIKHKIAWAGGALFALLSLFRPSLLLAADVELSMLSSWPASFVLNRDVAEVFAAEVEKASEGRIKIRVYGPDVIPSFEQISPVQDGVFDMLASHPAYHSGTVGSAMSIDGVRTGVELRRQSGAWDVFDRLYQKHGLKMLSIAQLGDKSLQFITREPFDPETGYQGRVIRGTVPWHYMIRKLGGAPMVLPASGLYSALERGVVDGAGFSLFGVAIFRMDEVARFMVRPAYASICAMIMMNGDRWAKLSPEDQQLLLDVGYKFEHETLARLNRLIAEEEALLLSRGVKFDMLPEPYASNLDQWWAAGAWQASYELRPQETEEVFQQIRAIDMSLEQNAPWKSDDKGGE